MSYLLLPDPISPIQPVMAQSFESAAVDHFDRLPDSLLLLVFDRISDIKALGRCCLVSRRFHSLVPLVENVLVRVDCVISDDDSSSSAVDDPRSASASGAGAAASFSDAAAGGSFSSLFRLFFGPIFKPFQALGQFLGPKRSYLDSSAFGNGNGGGEIDQGGVTHHSPTQVLRNFNEIRFLRIELPSGELGIDDGVLLKWRADFGSTLDNCVILGASSVSRANPVKNHENSVDSSSIDDIGNIPESFYTNGGLKLRVVWTISSLIAASARHYLLQPIITEHKTLDRLILSDADGQGVLSMNREQLEELRVKPLSASSASKRTLVPALNMRLWYSPQLDLPDGTVFKGATLVAIRPSESKEEACDDDDASWLSDSFEEPYGTAAKMLIKRRTYCLEMNSF
ncbi:PREDICTED: F-box protein At1g30200 [Tarenaya hassleriana]|uniref:F-box protein At1g30200 n=1 Tax=Tarenaya hassleriana TaxID=28532 RepID=UPI00053C3407|nr:PREDICTED: F-box protein At1g30200 [Tarenaya hassleriana]